MEEEYELLSKQGSLLTITRDDTTTVEKIYVPEISGIESEYKLFSYHCNGIVCRVSESAWLFSQQRVVFYNPALRQHKYVTTSRHFPVCYGFGHDPKTDDYKFVRIVEISATSCRAEVYTLRTGLWREFEIEHNVYLYKNGVYLKGRCYWVNYSHSNILSFDVCDESFSSLDLPPGKVWRKGENPRLFTQGESLVFIVEFENFEVWVMDGNGGGGGWAKQFRIELSTMVGSISTFWKEDEVLIKMECEPFYLTYNLRTKHLNKFSSVGTVSLYVESLVSVEARNNDVVRCLRRRMRRCHRRRANSHSSITLWAGSN